MISDILCQDFFWLHNPWLPCWQQENDRQNFIWFDLSSLRNDSVVDSHSVFSLSLYLLSLKHYLHLYFTANCCLKELLLLLSSSSLLLRFSILFEVKSTKVICCLSFLHSICLFLCSYIVNIGSEDVSLSLWEAEDFLQSK